MAHTKTHEDIEKELLAALQVVTIGGIYAHFKNPDHLYKVVSIATQEATEKICVIYQAQYGKKLTFVRNLDSWLETPELQGKKVPRFTLVK